MNRRYFYPTLLIVIMAVDIITCSRAFDFEVTIADVNKTNDIKVEYSLDGGSYMTLGVTDSDGLTSGTIHGVSSDTKIFLRFQKPGYEISVLSQSLPIIPQTRKKIKIDIKAIAAEKKIKVVTNPRRAGVDVFGRNSKNGTTKLGRTGFDGTTVITINNSKWDRIEFSFKHPEYTILSPYQNHLYDYQDRTIELLKIDLLPAKPLNYRFVVLDAVFGFPQDAAEIGHAVRGSAVRVSEDGYCELKVDVKQLRDWNVVVGDSLTFNIRGENLIPVSVTRAIDKRYETTNSPIDTIRVFRGITLVLDFFDPLRQPIADINVSIDNTSIGTTGNDGKIDYKYETSRVGDTVRVTAKKDHYEPFTAKYVLSPMVEGKAIELKPYNYFLKIKNQSNGNPVDDLEITSPRGIKVLPQGNGRYELLFKEIGKDYHVAITDPQKEYEQLDVSLSVNEGTLGHSKTVLLINTTFIRFEISDHSGDPLQDVEILANGSSIGKTGADGRFTKTMRFEEQNLTYTLEKLHYADVPVSLSLKAGENVISAEMEKFLITFEIQNMETHEPITGLTIRINGNNYTSNDRGLVEYSPKSDGEHITFEYNNNMSSYLTKKSSIKFDPKMGRSNVVIQLEPRSSIEVHSVAIDPRGQVSNVPGVSITLNGKDVGVTNASGNLVIKMDNHRESCKVSGTKKGYIVDQIEIPAARETVYEAQLIVSRIAETFLLVDGDYNYIPGAKISLNGIEQATTDGRGRATVFLDNLKEQVNVSISDPQGRFLGNQYSTMFVRSGQDTTIKLFPRPVKMIVQLAWDGTYSPAAASLDIIPSPSADGRTRYELGIEPDTIEVFKSGTYKISYTTKSQPFVSGEEVVKVNLGEKIKNVQMLIRSAQFRVLIDQNDPVPVTIYEIKPDSSFVALKTIRGDGREIMDASATGYIDYKFEFTRKGMQKPESKVARLTTPGQVFDFTLEEHYAACLSLKAQGKYAEACAECLKVPMESPDYCDAKTELIFLYEKLPNGDLDAAEQVYEYVSLMNSICEKNQSYYQHYFLLLAGLKQIPAKMTMNDGIRNAYDDFKTLIVIANIDEKEKTGQIRRVQKACAEISIKCLVDVKNEYNSNRRNANRRNELQNSADRIKRDLNDYVSGLEGSVARSYLSRAETIIAGMQ